MARNDGVAYSGPLSPEEVAECDRELEEMGRKLFEQIDRDIERDIELDIERDIERDIQQGVIDEVLYAMD